MGVEIEDGVGMHFLEPGGLLVYSDREMRFSTG